MTAPKPVRDKLVTVRLTREETQTLKAAAVRHESTGQTIRRLALLKANEHRVQGALA